MTRKSKFTLLDVFIVFALLLIVAPIVRPKLVSATVAPISGFLHQRASR
jgi:hypothetical protein